MSSGEHFIVQKGKAQCNKGTSFPKFKVTSHQQHYWNDSGGNSGNLAVTEDDLSFDPSAKPFGSCALKKDNPCSFAPAGKWTKTYDKVKVMGKKCLIESSELQCAVGGKITVMKHGQVANVTAQDVEEANPEVIEEIDPLVDLEELKDDNQMYAD